MSDHETATAYPLSWPMGRARTPSGRRENPPFSRQERRYYSRPDGKSFDYLQKRGLTIADARERLEREVELLRARNVILSTNVELRQDGLPYSNRKPPDDPGVALYFRYKGIPTVLACDRFTTVAGNIAAIASHIEGMRKAERHGVGSLEQMFRGFTALPGATAVNDWRKALGEPKSLAEAEAFYRHAMKTAHPDAGGSEAKAAMLNAAIAEARKVLK